MATTSEDLAERSLLTAARDGDDDAIAALFERHLDAARAVATRLTRTPADADDVLAAAAEAVLAAIRRGNGPTEAFGPYLVTAVRRQAWRRTADARHATPGEVPDTPVGDTSLASIESDTLRRAFAELPPAQRDLLWLAEVEGRSPAELAAVHGSSANTMAAAALRARRGLRRAYILAHLGPDAPGPCRDALGRLAGSSRRNTSADDVARADAHAVTCAPCAEVLADLADLRRQRRGLLVLLPAAWQLRRLGRVAPETMGGAAPEPGLPASRMAPGPSRPASTPAPVPGVGPGRRAAALVGAGAVATVVLVAAIATQLDQPEAASAGPTTSIGGADRRAGTEGDTASADDAGAAADAEATADAEAAGETGTTMATGGPSTDVAPTSDAGEDAGITGTRSTQATAAPPAPGPTPQAPTPTAPAAPPTTTLPTTPTTAPKPFATVDLGIVGQATPAPAGMLSEFHVQLTNHGAGTWATTDGPVTVTMAFVDGLTVEQIAADAGWSCGAPKGLALTCTIDPVAPGTTTVATLAVRVSAARAPGDLPVVVTVGTPSPDTDAANDKTVVTVAVI